jgi:hypothetical protein
VKRASDIDLAFDCCGKILPHILLVDIKYEFEESSLPHNVDVMDLSKISDSFKEFIKDDLVKIGYIKENIQYKQFFFKDGFIKKLYKNLQCLWRTLFWFAVK